MTTALLVGVQLEVRLAVGADALLGSMKFARADPILDRYGLRVANAVDPRSKWWVWDPENGDAVYGLSVDFDERWRAMFDDLFRLIAERRVVHIVVAHMGDVDATTRFDARDWSGLVERMGSLFSSTAVPADSCAIEYAPQTATAPRGGHPSSCK